jgi:diguanylate cyclase (GGDEF)-like protein
MRIYPWIRILAIGNLALYLLLRSFLPPSWLSELIIFNLALILSIFSIFYAPTPDDPSGRRGTALALGFWLLGSVASFIDLDFADFGYALFYPAAIYGITRALHPEEKSSALELLDTAIIALGGTTVIAALLINPMNGALAGSPWEIFLAILYPVGDTLILIMVLIITLRGAFTIRSLFILVGVSIFTITDFIYLWKVTNLNYQFGELSDLGWIIAFILISESFWHQGDESRREYRFNPIVTVLALLASSLILVINVILPGYFPRFTLIPAFATIALAFIRMAVAIRDAQALGDQERLARTDELTGIANRRRFLSEFQPFSEAPGSLLILDLNGFKPVNDRLGHEAGDQLLTQVARRLERVLPEGGLLARLGGDEFGALIPGEEGFETALAMRATLTYPFTINKESIHLDIAIGEAFNNPLFDDGPDLLRRADAAMYQAKRSGKGVERWSDEIHS